MRGLLHDARDVLDEDPGGWVFVVDALVVGVGDFAGLVDEDAVVGAHARVHHADVRGDEGDFGEGGGVDEGGGGFLFGGEDDAVGGWVFWGGLDGGSEKEEEKEGEEYEVVGGRIGDDRSRIPLIPREVTPWLTAANAYSGGWIQIMFPWNLFHSLSKLYLFERAFHWGWCQSAIQYLWSFMGDQLPRIEGRQGEGVSVRHDGYKTDVGSLMRLLISAVLITRMPI